MSKLLYVYLVSISYLFFLSGLEFYIEARFFAGYFNSYTSVYFIAMHTILLLVTAPLLALFFRKLVRPAVINSRSPAWRNMWLIPAIFLMVSMLIRETYDINRLGEHQFLAVTLLLNLGLFFVYYVVIRMVIQTEKAANAQAQAKRLAVEKELLDQQGRMKTEFLQNMSHEMKAPLTVIATDIDFADREIAKGSADLTEVSAALESAQNQTQRLGRMVSGMIKMAALGEMGDSRKRVDLSALLANTAEAFRIALMRRNNRLSVNIAAGLPDVFVESERFSQVMTNLFANALDHTQNGEVVLTAYVEGALITVRVADTGGGIDAELLPHVFERGVSGRGGTGYGLYICKTIVEAHGGAIWAESGAGGGTAVTFTVPVYGGQEAGHR